MRLVDADKFLERVKKDREHEIYLHSWTADMVLERLDSWYAPTVEVIPKDQYEARLKADMMIILDYIFDKIKAEVEQTKKMYLDMNDIDWLNGCDYVLEVVDKYKEKVRNNNENNK